MQKSVPCKNHPTIRRRPKATTLDINAPAESVFQNIEDEINLSSQDPRKFIFVYGSLKRGLSNHDKFGSLVFLSEATIKDFTLYNVGAFPAAVRKKGREIKGEVVALDFADWERIHFMELGVGYAETEAVTTDGETVKLYIRPPDRIPPESKEIGSAWTREHEKEGFGTALIRLA